jgi:thiamine-phosphate pyrophosphorylase
MLRPPSIPTCSLTLITPPLSLAEAVPFAAVFAQVVAAAPIASALVRLGPGGEGDAKTIVSPLIKLAVAVGCALIVENDARLAARLGADGVHVAGSGEALEGALKSLKPGRIVGAGALRTRDEAMNAGEKGADYVMFGEPTRALPAAALETILERVDWWVEIFETPCVAYSESIDAAAALARAGADFVAVEGAVWRAASPPDAARLIQEVLLSSVSQEAR